MRVGRLEALVIVLAIGAAAFAAPAAFRAAADATGTAITGLAVHRAGAFVDEDAVARLGAVPVVVERLLGTSGGEPNVGVTSTGAAFVSSGDRAMRSRDVGRSWQEVFNFGTYTLPPDGRGIGDFHSNSDPMLWVDPTTDRVFLPAMWPALVCSDVAFSDDEGATWFTRPLGCGLPGVDHQKLATGPRARASPMAAAPGVAYPNVVYYCYNKLATTDCAVSVDGGLTFPLETVALRGCGGIAGHPAAAPDGTVYVPAGNNCNTPVIAVSRDNGLTWTSRMPLPLYGGPGEEEIDPEITVTPDGTAYYMWRASRDHRMYVIRSADGFATYDGPFLVSPPDVRSTNFAGMTSGDDGRIAFAYLGTRDTDRNAGDAPAGTRWHLFVTLTFDADADEPTFVTTQVTPAADPVQVGHIWQGGGGNAARNMLDFIDLHHGPDGRIWVAFTDGCTRNCAGKATAQPSDSRASDTAVAVLVAGPSLLAEAGVLGDSE